MTTPEERTPTPKIDQIWSRSTTLDRWHSMWIWHLSRQIFHNPSHPGTPQDLKNYREAAQYFRSTLSVAPKVHQDWLDEVAQEEAHTRHDVMAALNVFNRRAGAETAHLGLTSHDIVEYARQVANWESLHEIIGQVQVIRHQLAEQVQQHQGIITVARTHGQPAQAIPYSLRIMTVLEPLQQWTSRASASGYRARPPRGAVGTSADLHRVVHPADAHRYLDGDSSLALGISTFTRQTQHRSYDLVLAGLVLQLANIARTWAADRRLEAMLGLGYERRDAHQVGSSAMPHKVNPVLAERIHGLCAVVTGYHATAVEAAGLELLEGDISASSARRHWLPGMWRTAAQILANWGDAIARWQLDTDALDADLRRYDAEIHTGAALWWLIRAGVPRQTAHEWIARVMANKPDHDGGAQWLAHALVAPAHEWSMQREQIDGRGVDLQRLEEAWKEWDLHLEYIQGKIDTALRMI